MLECKFAVVVASSAVVVVIVIIVMIVYPFIHIVDCIVWNSLLLYHTRF